MLRGPKLEVSLDHVVEDELRRLWMGSHLTDEVWVVTPEEAFAHPTCGWPFVTLFLGLYDAGDALLAYDPRQEPNAFPLVVGSAGIWVGGPRGRNVRSAVVHPPAWAKGWDQAPEGCPNPPSGARR